MRLGARLLALGVALPMTGLVGAVFIAGSLFRASLERAVDERLYAQAAVESVSLFDGPDRRPHVHIPKSPLAAEVAAFAPWSVLFDPDGHLVASPVGTPPDLPMPPRETPGRPRLADGPERTRTLTVGVDRTGEGVYTLHLVASLAPVDRTMTNFYRSVGGTVAAIALVLLIVLSFQARTLTRRIHELIGFVPLLRAARAPAAQPAVGNDELAELGEALTDAARFLHEQQSAQERFLANAAHQLRTPLAVLTTEIDVALRRPREAAALRESLEQARTETDRLTLLARKLLDFESLRVQQIERREIDVSDLVHDVVERTASTATARRIRVHEEIADVSSCYCDPFLVSQAIENVVDNALRFAPEGSTVAVHARCDGVTCTVTVHDDGPGIPLAERDRVFEPFFRGTTPGSQTGLGLAFVADVARKHGGRALLEDVERGTTLRLELPCGM
jgi:signal transduction histidine kinase